MDDTVPAGDWQSRKTVRACNSHMLENKLACDITCIVGPGAKRIEAHKYMLISRSLEFRKLIEENPGVDLVLPDISEETFNLLLRFIYCDEDSFVSPENVEGILNAARKYELAPLHWKCMGFLKRGHKLVDACSQLEISHQYNDAALRELCLEAIRADAVNILTPENIQKLCVDCLSTIVNEDGMALSEENLFRLVLGYAQKKCTEQGKPVLPENLMAVLSPDIINNIRYPLMSLQFFVDNVEPTGLLAQTQILAVYRYFNNKQLGRATNVIEFNCNARKVLYMAKRFEETASEWGCPGDKRDAITFMCDKEIMLNSIQVYGTCLGPGQLSVNLRLVQEPYGAILLRKNVTLETDGAQKVYDIKLDEPTKILKDKKFTIILTFQGSSTYYGVGGKAELQVEDTHITFSNSNKSTNTTSIHKGQIQGFVFEPCK